MYCRDRPHITWHHIHNDHHLILLAWSHKPHVQVLINLAQIFFSNMCFPTSHGVSGLCWGRNHAYMSICVCVWVTRCVVLHIHAGVVHLTVLLILKQHALLGVCLLNVVGAGVMGDSNTGRMFVWKILIQTSHWGNCQTHCNQFINIPQSDDDCCGAPCDFVVLISSKLMLWYIYYDSAWLKWIWNSRLCVGYTAALSS